MPYTTRPYVKSTFGLMPDPTRSYEVDENNTLHIKSTFGKNSVVQLEGMSITIEQETLLFKLIRKIFGIGTIIVNGSSGTFECQRVRNISEFESALRSNHSGVKKNHPQNILHQAKKFKQTNFGENRQYSHETLEQIESPIGNFSINKNRTVINHSENLMWIRAPWGLIFDGEKFDGSPIKVGWKTATNLFGKGVRLPFPVGALNEDHLNQSKFNNGFTSGKCTVSFAGYTDWRLPTAYEIDTVGCYKKSLGYDTGCNYCSADNSKVLREKLFPNLSNLTGNNLWCANDQDMLMAWATDGRWSPGDHQKYHEFHILLVRKI